MYAPLQGQAEAATAGWTVESGNQNSQPGGNRRASATFSGQANQPGSYDDGMYEVRAGAPVGAGEPVVLCYGNLSNELLLARYGFVDPLHPADVAALHPTAGVTKLIATAAKRRREGTDRTRRTVGTLASCAGVETRKQSRSTAHNKKIKRAAEAEATNCCSVSSPIFCWSSRCHSCRCRSATLADAGLWPLENAGECSFFSPTEDSENNAAGLNATDVGKAVSWNMLCVDLLYFAMLC